VHENKKNEHKNLYKRKALVIYHHATPLKRNYVQRFLFDSLILLVLVLKIEINDFINIL